MAGELQSKFENLGYKVFLDVDEIGSGQFPTQIKQAIEQCKDFLLVLSPGTLDRCVDEEDWVRREILMAMDLNKNIVGVGLPGFIMPEAEDLPKPLQSLATRQVFVWTHEYRAASFAKIAENLVSTQVKKKKKRVKLIASLPLLLALLVAGLVLLNRSPKEEAAPTDEVENAVNEAAVFENHVGKAGHLAEGLPSSSEFDEQFLSYIDKKDCFFNLMDAIAEYDSAKMLKDKYPGQVTDSYDVEKKQSALLDLRSAYMNRIVSDIEVMVKEGGEMFAAQDMEVAKILALPAEKPWLDSMDKVITNRLNN